jgi:hypothetical protein
MLHMTEVTYRVDTQRISLFRYAWIIHEIFHMPTTTHDYILGHGTAHTEAAARRATKRLIRRRNAAMRKPSEIWA